MQPWLDLIKQQGGFVTLLLFILYAGYRQFWTYGWYTKKVEQDRDEWKDRALKGISLVEQALQIVEGQKGAAH